MNRLLSKLRHEPVAVWGALLALLAGVLRHYGVSDDTLATIMAAAGLLGIPVVRSQVSPVAPPADAAADGEAGHGDVMLVLTVATFLLVLGLCFGWLPK